MMMRKILLMVLKRKSEKRNASTNVEKHALR